MYYDRKSMKIQAKQAMRQARPKPWLVTLLLSILLVAVPMIVNSIAPNPISALIQKAIRDPNGFIRSAMSSPDQALSTVAAALGSAALISLLVSILLAIYRGIMNYGYCSYALKVYCQAGAGVGDLFNGFHYIGHVVGASIMVYIFKALWTALILVGTGVAAALVLSVIKASNASVLVVIVLLVLALIALLCITYRYCLTPYFVLTHPELGVFGAITASKQTMKGHTAHRFVLELSFLGWHLLLGLIALLLNILAVALATTVASFNLNTFLLQIQNALEDLTSASLLAIGGTLLRIVAPYLAFFLVAGVITGILNLWLTAYKATAAAGFFCVLVGAQPAAAAPEAPTPAAAYAYPQAGAAAPGSYAPAAPFTPSAPTPAAPAAPVTQRPVTPVTPGPVSPVTQRPVTPVTPGPVSPVVPGPVSPVTPGPVTPVTPGPVQPVTPAAPQAPDAPFTPYTPFGQGTPPAPTVSAEDFDADAPTEILQ